MWVLIYVPNAERHNIKERHPRLLGQELLRECQCDGARDPGYLHDRHEAGAHGGADLMPCSCACDDGHGGEVDGVLDGSDDKVGGHDLEDLGLEGGAAGEDLLE